MCADIAESQQIRVPQLHHLSLTFRARSLGSGTLPAFVGGMLRGAIMWAYRAQACPFPPGKSACENCDMEPTCPYAYLFETRYHEQVLRAVPGQDAPRPFVLVVPLSLPSHWRRGRVLEFSVRLFGRAYNHTWSFVEAVHRALDRGLGADRLRFRLLTVESVGRDNEPVLVWDGSRSAYPEQGTTNDVSGQASARVRVRFETPVRIKKKGRVTERLAFPDFGFSLVQRIHAMSAVHETGRDRVEELPASLTDLLDDVESVHEHLKRVSVQRWSNRQKKAIWLDGLVGEIVWQGQGLIPLASYLSAGQLTHVGQGAVFGLGRFDLEFL